MEHLGENTRLWSISSRPTATGASYMMGRLSNIKSEIVEAIATVSVVATGT